MGVRKFNKPGNDGAAANSLGFEKDNLSPEMRSALRDFTEEHDKALDSVDEMNQQINEQQTTVKELFEDLEAVNKAVNKLKSELSG